MPLRDWEARPRQETGHRQTTETSVAPPAEVASGPRGWPAEAQLAIRQLAGSGRGFDVDHLLAMVGPADHPQQLATVFAAAQRSRVIECVGCRVAADGRLTRVWWAAS